MALKDALYKARDNLFLSVIGNKIVYLTKVSGIYWKFARYYAKKRARQRFSNPTKEMLESQSFFSKNSNRIDRVISWLADDKSKECYRKMINYRCSYDMSIFPACNENAHYFLNDFTKYSCEEILVDCGAFTGDSIDFFIHALKCYGGKYKHIVAFEPDIKSYNILYKRRIPNVTAINTGVYSSDTTLYFEGGQSRSSSFGEPFSDSEVSVKSIDGCIECYNATFIKMDIEGSEFPALQGAKKTITNNNPTLAISIYHSDEDMIRIAEWIHDLNLDYRLYVRQHSTFNKSETVLYAVK